MCPSPGSLFRPWSARRPPTSCQVQRRVVARLETIPSLGGEARHLYEDIYCARGQAENLIKLPSADLTCVLDRDETMRQTRLTTCIIGNRVSARGHR